MSTDKENLQSLIEKLDELPTLPTVISKITSLMQNPRTSASEVGQAITTDQSLTSKTLKLVNSAFYGFPGRINTVTHAIVILGFTTVKNIVLTTSILNAFSRKGNPDNGFDLKAFWLHSISTGAVSKVLAKKINPKLSEEAFIGGLLHDLGKVVVCQFAQDEFEKILAYRDEHQCLLKDAEKEVLGLTHQEIGAWLGERWNLPRDLTSIMQYHHKPASAGVHQEICGIIHMADILIRALGVGSGGDSRIPIVEEDVWMGLKMDKLNLKNVLELVEEEVDKASIFLEVM